MTVLVSTTSPRPEKQRSHASREASRAGGRRVLPHLVLVGLILYFALPFWWLIVASTKDQATLFSGDTSPLWFGKFNLIDNIQLLFTYSNGLYWHWLGNSFLYALTGGIGATVISVLAGYGFAQYRFAGRTPFFALVLGSVMVPATALVIPMFVMFSATHLTNTMWAVILPSMLNPFGVYLMRVYTQDAIPDEMIDAARMDGAGELRIFFRVALPCSARPSSPCCCSKRRRHLEQLFPAARDVLQPEPVPRHRRARRPADPGRRQHWRAVALDHRHRRSTGLRYPAHHRLPHDAEVLAGRALPRQRQVSIRTSSTHLDSKGLSSRDTGNNRHRPLSRRGTHQPPDLRFLRRTSRPVRV
ncbi:carbohydrate ABC transporter permease [Cryobacterium sp. 10C3]|uniref:carbohydrate ABC transporter permease n=1 Tax=Cryobacterium sp. 10C3 TaxID=3048577 RepID=UPI002AB56C98|nr:carbohydrate ABC transporter permease [Cryobacterium sp. 10C3]MDY7558641.1 carbohydrate ABC transporter permease [Cryobacterium sp. 10C3]